MPNPIEILEGLLNPSEEEKKISESKKMPLGGEAEKLAVAPEIEERHPEKIEIEKRETLEKEAREMLLTPDQEEVLAKGKKTFKGLSQEEQDIEIINFAKEHGRRLAIKALLDEDDYAYALDRLHRVLNNPEYTHILERE